MIFPRKSRKEIAPAAWWQAPNQQKATKGNVILIALLAGSVGGVLGVNASGGDIFHRVQLVSSTSTIERAPDSVAGIAQRVLPSVVSISTRTLTGGGTGSGFIIDSSGYILTNNHVISEAAQSGGSIQVSLNDGTFYSAKVIGRDASYDLAVLKITASGLKALQFGDSDSIAVGDSVIAIGSPLGLTGTVTTGIISAKNRAVTAGESNSESSFINALQTDAAINPGNSGGPLVDATGAVIGVNSAIASLGTTSQIGSIGLGFAIPINQARKTADQLISLGLKPVLIKTVSVGNIGGPEAAARDARYEALNTAADELGAVAVLLGHTLDDQAETVLLGLARGSGARSLQAMASASGRYLRPMLAITRQTTEAFCTDSELGFWQDPMNQDERYARVRVRKNLLPALEAELGPGVASALARTADQFREDEEVLSALAESAYSELVSADSKSLSLPVDGFKNLPLALRHRVLASCLEVLAAPTFARVHILAVDELVDRWHGQKPLTLPGVRVERLGDRITLTTTKTLKPGAC
jgi:putative serine protease PepD